MRYRVVGVQRETTCAKRPGNQRMRSVRTYMVQQGDVRFAAVAQCGVLQACVLPAVEEQLDKGFVGIAKMAGSAVQIAPFSLQAGQVEMRNDHRGHAVISSSWRRLSDQLMRNAQRLLIDRQSDTARHGARGARDFAHHALPHGQACSVVRGQLVFRRTGDLLVHEKGSCFCPLFVDGRLRTWVIK